MTKLVLEDPCAILALPFILRFLVLVVVFGVKCPILVAKSVLDCRVEFFNAN
jgi:hypothetical protein